jgi:hypothetical protein
MVNDKMKDNCRALQTKEAVVKTEGSWKIDSLIFRTYLAQCMLHVELRAFDKHAEQREHTWPTKSMIGTCTTTSGHGINGAQNFRGKHRHMDKINRAT